MEANLVMSSGPVGPMATSQGVAAIHLTGITRDANGYNAPNLEGHKRGGSAGVMLIEEPMVMTLQAHMTSMTLMSWVEGPIRVSGKSSDPYWITCMPNARGW